MVFHLHLAFPHTRCCGTLLAREKKKKELWLFSFLYPHPLAMWHCNSYLQEIRFPQPLSLSWPDDLLWLRACGENDVVPVLSLDLKRDSTSTHSLGTQTTGSVKTYKAFEWETREAALWVNHLSHPRSVSYQATQQSTTNAWVNWAEKS